jgi:peroxiredoxin
MATRESEDASGAKVVRQRLGTSTTLLSVFLALSAAMNFLLARDVANLKEVIETLRAEGQLQVGTVVPVIRGRSVGTAGPLDYGDVNIPTVLYVFTPQCSWCKKNLDNLRVLIDSSNSRYRVIGISLNNKDLEEYLEKEHLRFPVYTDIPESTKAAYRLGGTPTTIVISPSSRVLKLWHGAYQESIRQEIDDYLKVKLPGCCSLSDTDAEHH